jgi:hypothetical protein
VDGKEIRAGETLRRRFVGRGSLLFTHQELDIFTALGPPPPGSAVTELEVARSDSETYLDEILPAG